MTMKNIAASLLIFFCIITGASTAQPKSIPPEVLTAFKMKYPMITNVKWVQETNAYAANFYVYGQPCNVKYNRKGEWLEQTKKLSFGDLRDNVKNGFSQSKFGSWYAQEVNTIEEKDKEVQYRILIRNADQQKKYIYFDSKGQLKKEVLTM